MSNNNMTVESTQVLSFMTANVKTAMENQPIREVCKMMYQNKNGSMLILKKNAIDDDKSDDKKPIGIVTERDIVRLMGSSDMSLDNVPVGELMSVPLITINPNNSIKDAIEIMQQKDIRRLPVVDNKGKMVGIITDKDVFRAMLKNQTLVTSFLGDDQLLVDQQLIYAKFSDYWFNDILPRP
jgi:signal-transduction protein with cAMP-binding, CBS, and nucleotidyltransferase domain